LKKPELDEEQIEERDQNRPNKGQPTTSPDEHINCKDLKIIYRSDRINSPWPFVGAGKNVIEVGRGRRDLIHSVIFTTTLLLSLETKPRRKKLNLQGNGSSLLSLLAPARPPEGKEGGPSGTRGRRVLTLFKTRTLHNSIGWSNRLFKLNSP
jgi:hypothetical protein